jgi:diaminopimelate epimerase
MVYKMKLADISEIELVDAPFGPGAIVFTKLHGNGNDFILVDEMARELVPEPAKKRFALLCCSRNFGIGGDGVLFMSGSDHADLRMRLFQPDGSEAEMCGNGIRCLAKYAWDAGYVGDAFDVETLAGRISIQVKDMDNSFWARVDMGVPNFERQHIPAIGNGEFLKEAILGFEVSAVNTGVPHCVIFVEDLELPIEKFAPQIRHNFVFPEGANVNFAKAGDSLKIRTFERGIEGETFSCGTGAVASAAVARRLDLVGDEVLVETNGGPLIVSFEGNRAFLEGPASTVYHGELSDEYNWSLLTDRDDGA